MHPSVIRLCALLVVLGVAVGAAPAQRTDDLDRHKAIARRWIEDGFNRGNLDVVAEIFADGVIVNGQRVGRQGLRDGMSARFAAFPDLQVDLTATVAEADEVAIWYTARGTHRGDFGAVRATGKSATWTGSDLLRFDGNTIVEARFLDDSLGLMRQLGAVALR
jgi:predicted ester cyclase